MTGTGISGTMDTRFAAEGVDFEARVIGNTVETIMVKDPLSLGKGVALEGIGILGYVVMTAYVGKADYAETSGKHRAKFAEFMGIVCGKDYLLEHILFSV